MKKYVLELEKQMSFKIKTIQVDNGAEFVISYVCGYTL